MAFIEDGREQLINHSMIPFSIGPKSFNTDHFAKKPNLITSQHDQHRGLNFKKNVNKPN